MIEKSFILRPGAATAAVAACVATLAAAFHVDPVETLPGEGDLIAGWLGEGLVAQYARDPGGLLHLGIALADPRADEAAVDAIVTPMLPVEDRHALAAEALGDPGWRIAAALANRHDPPESLIDAVRADLGSIDRDDIIRGLLAAGYLENTQLLPALDKLRRSSADDPPLSDGAGLLIAGMVR